MSLRGLVIGLAGLALVTLPGLLAMTHGPGRDLVLAEGASPTYAPVRLAQAAAPVGTAPGSQVAVSRHWVRRMAGRTGVPEPALRAYATAQLASPCGVGWTTLAGIGWVESAHGTVGGRSLAADGTSSTAILGPALDGHGRFAAIPATPASRQWHGDRRWDHAVGPLQFLPSTWKTWGVDGDGDGEASPNDVDDAALAAADYLCADGRDLSSGAGWASAVFSYNHERAYVEAVRAAAVEYAARAR